MPFYLRNKPRFKTTVAAIFTDCLKPEDTAYLCIQAAFTLHSGHFFWKKPSWFTIPLLLYTINSAFVITILLLKFKIGNKTNYVELYFSFAYSQVYSYIYIFEPCIWALPERTELVRLCKGVWLILFGICIGQLRTSFHHQSRNQNLLIWIDNILFYYERNLVTMKGSRQLCVWLLILYNLNCPLRHLDNTNYSLSDNVWQPYLNLLSYRQ